MDEWENEFLFYFHPKNRRGREMGKQNKNKENVKI
jgi:hypothetical protein